LQEVYLGSIPCWVKSRAYKNWYL